MLLAALRFWQVPFSSPADADVYLAHLAAIAPFDDVSVSYVFHALTARFRGDAPGWYPLGPLPLAFWFSGASAAAVKSVQYVLLIGSFGLFAFVARKVLGSSAAAILAVILALCAWQFRTIHDPAIGTSLLSPWAAITVLAACAFWLGYRESGKTPQLCLCYLALALAMLNGPVALGLGAVLATVALRSERRAPAIGLCAIVFAGAAAIATSGAFWTMWQHGGGFARNVALQLFAALPASFRAVGNLPVARVADLYFGTRYVDDRFVLIPPISLAGWAFAVVSAAAGYLVSFRAPITAPLRRGGDALIFGLGFWLVPAFALGAAGEWQGGVPLGQAFQSVYFEYFGFALLVTMAIAHVLRGASPAARLTPALVALAAFVLSYGNARSDTYAMAESARLDQPTIAIARAARAGFFDELPSHAVVVPSPELHLPSWSPSDAADPKYALFDYTGKRYSTQPYDQARPSPQTWILETSRDRVVPVTLSRWVNGDARNPLVDRALGFSGDRSLWRHAAGVRRGVVRTVWPLRDGGSIDARRLCGSVPLADAFEPSRPRVVWGDGFVPPGPIGYVTNPTAPRQSELGTYLTFFPKMYMASTGIVTIVPSSCPPGTIVFRFVAAAWRPSHLAVRTPGGVDRFDVDDTAPTIVIRTPVRTHAPFRLAFSTDAPAADWESNLFRYERDRPFKRRLVIEPSDLWETP